MSAPLAVAVLLCGPAAAPAPSAESVEGPVAVLPFKNLNADPGTDWLKMGIAETLISDLRRSGRVAVVERSHIDKAVAEIALQAMREPGAGAAPEEVSAARVGKLVGARTIVLGTFQRSGKKLRINARFVAVETGVVRGTAKVTGSLEGVFGLQDQVVAALLGTKAAARPPSRSRPRAVEAYRLYAMSLATASDAEKVDYLRRSLEVDPGFVYAREDLDALQRRMAGYAEASAARIADQEQALEARIRDGSGPPAARLEAARALLQGMTDSRRFRQMANAAARLSEISLPPPEGAALQELASERLVFARFRLRQVDLALQLGERHLQRFPGGQTYRAVESVMNDIVRARRQMASRRAEYQADLDEKRRDSEPGGLEWDFAPCIAARWNGQVNELMLKGCSEFLEKRGKDPDPDARDHAEAARFFVVKALAEMGDFDKARAAAEALIRDSERHAPNDELRALMEEWPVD